jgi:hypothetical protein
MKVQATSKRKVPRAHVSRTRGGHVFERSAAGTAKRRSHDLRKIGLLAVVYRAVLKRANRAQAPARQPAGGLEQGAAP